MRDVIDGVCLCGAVAFELREPLRYGPEPVMGVCHCTRCQHWTGGSGLPFVVAAPERFAVTAGSEQLAHYRDDQGRLRTFCRRCGSSLYYDAGTSYQVAAGALRDLKLLPSFHLHASDRPAWDRPAKESA